MVLLPGALAVLIALGTWQVQRLYWKEALLAAIEQRSTARARRPSGNRGIAGGRQSR
jgi:cytochrome oxidase assembly protein ShyY1